MHRVNLDAVPKEEERSFSGKYNSSCRDVSLALGGVRDTGPWGGGHPFDFQVRRIPPGAAIGPFHLHLAQWELFFIRTGNGTVRTRADSHPVIAGDAFIHPPGEAHQLINSGTSDLEVFIIADNPPLDAFYYPDSDKWGLRPPGNYFHITECDYLDDEDPSPSSRTGKDDQPVTMPLPRPSTPFAERKLHCENLPWEIFASPKKKFIGYSREISVALGAKRNTPPGLGGHPFDLELAKLPPGKSGCPYHSHATQWEFYVFLSGTGTVRTREGLTPVTAGDVVLHPPGEAHAFTNTGADELHYLMVTDNPPFDAWFYPDSNKWGLSSPRKFFRATEMDYWEGEE